MPIRDGYEEGRIHGFIDIRCWDVPILDASYYDYADQLWGYLLEMAQQASYGHDAACSMPDQPIELAFRLIGTGHLEFFVGADGGRRHMLPRQELLCALAREGERFFRTMHGYWPRAGSYPYYRDIAARLAGELGCMT